jgi:hypothetical protein
MIVVYSVVEYLYQRGIWNFNSSFGQRFHGYYTAAIMISFVLAIMGLVLDRGSVWLRGSAVILSLLGLLTCTV